MKKRILIIITILILVVLGIIGSIYFLSYKNDSQAKIESSNEINTLPENTINSIADDKNTVVNEMENNTVEENTETIITGISNETIETVEKKQETQTTTKNTQSSTQTKSSSSNNLSTPKKENVTQSTSQTTTHTSTTTPVTNPNSQSSSSQNNKQEENKTEPKVERCTNNNNHGMNIGNSGKWFNSKNDAIAYYNQQIKYWGDQWENNKIDNDTSYKNCPSGYEVWDCMYCGKWTINFYYR